MDGLPGCVMPRHGGLPGDGVAVTARGRLMDKGAPLLSALALFFSLLFSAVASLTVAGHPID